MSTNSNPSMLRIGVSVFCEIRNGNCPATPLMPTIETAQCAENYGSVFCKIIMQNSHRTPLRLCDQPRSSAANCAADCREHIHAISGCRQMFSKLSSMMQPLPPMGTCCRSIVTVATLTAGKHSTVLHSLSPSISSSTKPPSNIDSFIFL